MGNRGAIAAGDIQWMTAGRGIIHQEMPKGDSVGRMHGFQLWANLPASLKMTAPRYQEVKAAGYPADHRRRRHPCSRRLRKFLGEERAGRGIAADPTYLDVTVPPGKRKPLPVETTRHAFAYVFAGEGSSATPRSLLPFPPKPSTGPIQPSHATPTTVRSSSLIAATK